MTGMTDAAETSAPPRLVPILLYHSLTAQASPRYAPYALDPARFRDHLAYLRDAGFTALTIHQLLRAYREPAARWPARPIALTFDDGFEEMSTVALPALANVGFRATFYIVSGSVGATSWWLRREGEDHRPLLDWAGIRDVAAAGHEIGAHGHSHRELDVLPLTEAAGEISRSRAELELGLGRPITTFAYPHGYSSGAVRQSVEDAGFLGACSVRHAVSHPGDDPFALARVTIRGDTSVEQLAAWVAGEGIPLAAPRESLPTRGWRLLRRARRWFAPADRAWTPPASAVGFDPESSRK
jgi:peptidoglycan/xylan/chitin deacetylase (PgdA/CDA1 family)